MTAGALTPSAAPDSAFLAVPRFRFSADPLVLTFAFLVFALPYEAVPPGPLRGNGSPARFLGLVMLALILITIVSGKRFLPTRTAATAGVGLIVGYAALSLFSYATTYSAYYVAPTESANATRIIMGVASCLGIVAYVVRTTATHIARRAIIWALVCGAMVSVVIGLIQGVSTLDLRYLLVPPGFSTILEKGTTVREGFTRVFGTAGHPIEFSLTVAVTLPLAAHLARFARTRAQRITASVFTATLLVAVPASVSRTAIVAVATALVIYALVLPIRALIAALMVLATAVSVYAVVAPELFDAVLKLFTNAESDTSITARTEDYAYVGDLFRASPLLGYGLGSGETTARILDNQWLQAILSGGIIGVAAMLAIVVGGAFGAAHSLRHTSRDTPEQRDLVFAIAGGFAAMIVGFNVFDEFSFSQATLTLFLLYGLLWTFHSPGSDGLIVPPRPNRASRSKSRIPLTSRRLDVRSR